jgi:carbon starvation protein
MNSAYLLIAALCTYAIGYRFYSKWIAARALMLDDRRATPCERHDDGKDFVKTNKWIVFGHHFAAISGPGPLVGPVLAAQFGFLPGALWILIGVVLGGAVQDFVILFCSLRRDGKSLGQMLKEELNGAAGWIGLLAILSILVILLAVLGLVVVNALAESPWGIFTVGATIPIALLMGGYLRYGRTGKVLEASILGVVLLLGAVWGGQYVSGHPGLSQLLTFKKEPLAWAIVIYGCAASVLPIWLLLAPRDYLSAFMKLGTIFLLALGIFLILPKLQMPALTPFVHTGNGPVMAGKLFPFCFITIACGAVSGFHSLIASGTTPKMVTRESYARSIGYGAMCLESLVAILALIAACALPPGIYFSINSAGPAPEIVAKVNALGWPVSSDQMSQLAAGIGEKTLFGRVGGAPTLAVGMATIFSGVFHGAGLALWYHFAIMFEALFILTTVDAGTRVGRYLLQDVLGAIWKPLGQTGGTGAAWLASFLMVGAWGYFLIQGVRDPLGGVNSLWPLFGIANQLLASIALCLATTVILKIQLSRPTGKPARALITLLPLLWLLAVTLTAGVEKIFSAEPRLGFLAAARHLEGRLRFNALLDTVVTGVLLTAALLIVALSAREWVLLLARRKLAELKETPPVWLPDYALAGTRPLNFFGAMGLALLLVKELSGQSAIDRAQTCQTHNHAKDRQQAYLQTVEKRFDGINRCC